MAPEDGELPFEFHVWWMNDNHTFVKISGSGVDEFMSEIMACWEKDPWGMLSAHDIKGNPTGIYVHGEGRKDRDRFEAEARRVVTLMNKGLAETLVGAWI